VIGNTLLDRDPGVCRDTPAIIIAWTLRRFGYTTANAGRLFRKKLLK